MKNVKLKIYMRVLYDFRQALPSSKLFYFLYLFSSTIGLYLSTHNISFQENQNFTPTKILNKMLIINSLPNQPGSTINNFEIVSLLIFIVLIAYTSSMLVFMVSIKIWIFKIKALKERKVTTINKNKRYHSQRYSYSIYLLSSFLCLLALLNQHLIEVLLSSVYYFITSDSNNSLAFRIESPAIWNKYFLVAINVVSIGILVIYNSWFLFLVQTKTLSSGLGFHVHISNVALHFFSFIINLQGVYSWNRIFIEDKSKSVNLGINFILLFWLIVDTLVNHKYYVNQNTIAFDCISYSKHLCFVSGALEVVLYYFPTDMSQQLSFFKLIVEVISVGFVKWIYRNWFYISRLKETGIGLFRNKRNYDNLRLFVLTLKNKSHHSFIIIKEHCSQCEDLNCFCKAFIHDISTIETWSDEGDKTKENTALDQLYEKLGLVAEQEWCATINDQIKHNHFQKFEECVLLHIDYIVFVKKHIAYAYYLTFKYLNEISTKTNSFWKAYTLYETRELMYQKLLTDNHIDKAHNTPDQFDFSYWKFNSKIINVIKKCTKNYIEIVECLSPSVIKNNPNISAASIINWLSQQNNLNLLLNTNLDSLMVNPSMINTKLLFLLYHYLILFHSSIPKKYEDFFKRYYNNGAFTNQLNTKKNDEFIHTLCWVAHLTKEDDFIITYSSQSWCDLLQYKQSELHKSNFNVFLPPSIQTEHNIYMKLFILCGRNTNYSKNTFIWDKKNNLININIIAKTIPSIKKSFALALTMKWPDTDVNYFLLLEHDYQVLNTCREFGNIFLATEIMRKIKISFLDLFGINKRHVSKDMKGISEDVVDWKEINKSLTIMETIPYSKVFQLRSFKNLHKVLSRTNITDIKQWNVKIKQFIHKLDNLISFTKNIGIENCIVDRIENWKEVLEGNEWSNWSFCVMFKAKTIGRVQYYIVYIRETEINFNGTNHLSTVNSSQVKESSWMCSEINEKSPFAVGNKTSKNLVHNLRIKDIMNGSSDKSSPSRLHKQQESVFKYTSNTIINELTSNCKNNKNDLSSSTIRSIDTKNRLLDKPKTSYISQWNTRNQQIVKQISKKESKWNNKQIFFNNQNNDDKLENLVQFNNQTLDNSVCSRINAYRIKNITMYIYFLVFVICGIIILTIWMLNRYYNIIHNFFDLTYNMYQIKSNLSFLSLLFIRQCFIIDRIFWNVVFTPSTKDEDVRFDYNCRTLWNNLNNFQISINKINNYDKVNNIFSRLIDQDHYKNLNDDWTVSTFLSPILIEIYKAHYIFKKFLIETDRTTCYIKDFKKNFNINGVNGNVKGRKASEQEKVLFYIFNNVFPIHWVKWEELTMISYEISNQYIHELMKFFAIFFFMVMGCEVVILLLKLKQFGQDRYNITSILKKLIIQAHTDNKLKERILLYSYWLQVHTKSNCEKYEKDIQCLGNKADVNSNNKDSNNNNNNTTITHMKTTLINTNTENIAWQSIPSPEKDNKTRYSPNVFETTPSLNLIPIAVSTTKFAKLSNLPIINISYYTQLIIILLIIVYRIIVYCSIYLIHSDLTILNGVTLNILENLPLIADIQFYYVASILWSTPFYLTDEVHWNVGISSLKIINFYNIRVDTDLDSIFTSLKDTPYIWYYYKTLIAQGNIRHFIENHKSKANSLFPITFNNYKTFNQQGELPIKAGWFLSEIHQKHCNDIVNCMKLLNENAVDSLYIANKMSNEGIKTVSDYIINELNSWYSEFYKQITGETDGNDIDNIVFFNLQDYYNINESMQRTVKVVADIIAKNINVDIKNNIKYFMTIALLLSAIEVLIVPFLIIIVSGAMLRKIEFYKETLDEIGNKIVLAMR